MPEFLKGVDTWFLVLAAVGFLFMVNRSFGKFDKTLERFDELDAGLDAKIQIAEEDNSTEALKAKYGIDVGTGDETPEQMLERLNKQYS